MTSLLAITPPMTNALSGWQNFYVTVGSAAGALIGLQFVVLTLVSTLPVKPEAKLAGDAFATPSIVHFGTVLLLSAVLNAPWFETVAPAITWGLVGHAGVVYTIIVTRRMKQQDVYQPEFEDWLFHVLLPFVAYVLMAASAYVAIYRLRPALFIVGASALMLLFIGIHNAWDAITYHVFVQRSRQREDV